jgi:hypothetical protein
MFGHDKLRAQSAPRMTLDVLAVRAQICQHFLLLDAARVLVIAITRNVCLYTKCVSLEASLSTGMITRKKKIERIANPLAVRVWNSNVSICSG